MAPNELTKRQPTLNRDVLLLHTSDLHLLEERRRDGSRVDNLDLLERILNAADGLDADVLLLVGDTFDHNRMADAFLQRAAELLARSRVAIVILPGNHDPLTPDSVYLRGGLDAVPNVHVLGRANRRLDALVLPELDLELWGRPHLDYLDMAPFEQTCSRRTGWQVALAHGHVQEIPQPPPLHRAGWLISPSDIERTHADYVALGHWNRPACVSAGEVPAYYSGSLEYSGTVTLVRLGTDGTVRVSAEAVD